MSTLPDNELDLEKLFLPAWAQEPASAKNYANYQGGGEDRPDRRERRGGPRPPGRGGQGDRPRGNRPPGERRGPGAGPGREGGRGKPFGGQGRRDFGRGEQREQRERRET